MNGYGHVDFDSMTSRCSAAFSVFTIRTDGSDNMNVSGNEIITTAPSLTSLTAGIRCVPFGEVTNNPSNGQSISVAGSLSSLQIVPIIPSRAIIQVSLRFTITFNSCFLFNGKNCQSKMVSQIQIN